MSIYVQHVNESDDSYPPRPTLSFQRNYEDATITVTVFSYFNDDVRLDSVTIPSTEFRKMAGMVS